MLADKPSDHAVQPFRKKYRLGFLMNKILARTTADGNSTTSQIAQKPDEVATSDPSEDLAVVLYCKLQNIPIDVLYLIRAELDEVSAVCLKNTNQYFYSAVAITQPRQRSRCTRWLIACRFETDLGVPRNKYTCAFCKTWVPEKYFTRMSFKQVVSDLPYCLDAHSIRSEPVARYCSYHPPLTAWLPYQSPVEVPSSRQTGKIRWMEVRQLRCMHCTNAIDEETDFRDTGCKSCLCDVCPRVLSPAYIRYGPPSNPGYPKPSLENLNAPTFKDETCVQERGSKSLFLFNYSSVLMPIVGVRSIRLEHGRKPDNVVFCSPTG